MKKLSIVIPVYNESRDIEGCLKSVEMQDFPKKYFEVIIVDNYSTDNTLSLISRFSGKLNIRVLKNNIKNPEVSKMVGFRKAKGEFFMYLDADMRFADKKFIEKMLFPFKDDERIAGNFVQFKVNRSQPPLTRTISYDPFQRDPILAFFTTNIEDVVMEKRKKYWLCRCDMNHIPPQSLMVYRRKLLGDYEKNNSQLVDNEIPAEIVDRGHNYFAYVPSTGVEHLSLRSLIELARKRVRNLGLRKGYFSEKRKRKFIWIKPGKDWPKIILWIMYTNSIALPILVSLYKTFKYRDLCFLNEPVLNLVSTYSMIVGVLYHSFISKKD